MPLLPPHIGSGCPSSIPFPPEGAGSPMAHLLSMTNCMLVAWFPPPGATVDNTGVVISILIWMRREAGGVNRDGMDSPRRGEWRRDGFPTEG